MKKTSRSQAVSYSLRPSVKVDEFITSVFGDKGQPKGNEFITSVSEAKGQPQVDEVITSVFGRQIFDIQLRLLNDRFQTK